MALTVVDGPMVHMPCRLRSVPAHLRQRTGPCEAVCRQQCVVRWIRQRHPQAQRKQHEGVHRPWQHGLMRQWRCCSSSKQGKCNEPFASSSNVKASLPRAILANILGTLNLMIMESYDMFISKHHWPCAEVLSNKHLESPYGQAACLLRVFGRT